jgi:DNA-binding transcriptional LysR family regulator
VASPAYIARHGQAVSHPSGLVEHDCLLHSYLGDAWYFRSAGKSDAPPLEIAVSGALRANDLEVLLQATLDGLGIALLPAWLAEADVAAGRLLNLLGGWRATPTALAEDAVWALYPPKKVVSPKVRAFIGFYAKRLAKLG